VSLAKFSELVANNTLKSPAFTTYDTSPMLNSWMMLAVINCSNDVAHRIQCSVNDHCKSRPASCRAQMIEYFKHMPFSDVLGSGCSSY